jgi:hypothetical protein
MISICERRISRSSLYQSAAIYYRLQRFVGPGSDTPPAVLDPPQAFDLYARCVYSYCNGSDCSVWVGDPTGECINDKTPLGTELVCVISRVFDFLVQAVANGAMVQDMVS